MKPPIWRRFVVPADYPLGMFAVAIMAAFGWSGLHWHGFNAGPLYYVCDEHLDENGGELDMSEVPIANATVAHVVALRDRFTFTYDFGDNWIHDVKLERVLPASETKPHPVCTGGRRASPPEDCGGPWGYADLLRVLRDPSDKRHAEMLAWVGGSFDPEEFDRPGLNEVLRGMCRAVRVRGLDDESRTASL